ncbi:Nitric oxide synthase-interacting protein [Hondaea fermentalgiana]|uniref:Nitric oxide synthase-interacting protein n=1 Tax=Hondaea fermentalgiana TaxID=2315210 RepID=A0A2R5G4G6_9STRA|nr:Nitric oxide synthase-interacting protein [Hondaea fermentalgiana]|eukprot:GBG25917.1 Nitric oxide synthase-interacting protein [Hondaea fermentalgiana]
MPKNKAASSRGFLDRSDLESGSSRLTAARDARVRSSKDAAVPFGTCFLSLAPLHDPVASPSGHWYSREAMLQHILTKKREIKALQAAYDEQQENVLLMEQQAQEDAKLALEAEARRMMELGAGTLRDVQENVEGATDSHGDDKSKINKNKHVDVNGNGDDDQGNNSSALPHTSLEKRRRELLAGEERAHKKKKVDLRSRQEKLLELSHSSPWLARFAPEAKAGTLKAPPKRPPSPVSGAGIRVKDLVPFDVIPDPSDPGHALCAVSKRRIGVQPAVLLRPARAVISESVFDELVKPSMTCPLSGAKLTDKDIVRLSAASSSSSTSS